LRDGAIRDGVPLVLGQTFFQAAYDLSAKAIAYRSISPFVMPYKNI